MTTDQTRFRAYAESRTDLAPFETNALPLIALELRFGIEDIISTAASSITDGIDDKKADLVHIDSEEGYAVVAQSYWREDWSRPAAPSNKASDLNTAVSWLISSPIDDLPERMRPHAEELRREICEQNVNTLHIWYVHNLPESDNCRAELETAALTAKSAITVLAPGINVEVHPLEVGINTFIEWYHALSTPILVLEDFTIPISGGFELQGSDWKSYITAIPTKWLHEQFKQHGADMFSANIREYLGSRNADKNINSGIKETAQNDPSHFLVYNNGITALVHSFEETNQDGQKAITIKGISIINGAQTTGAVGNLE